MTKSYTNTSTMTLGEIYGLPIKPCMKSGFCCTKAPCGYGEWNNERSSCKYLDAPNDLNQRDCLRYQWIIDNAPDYKFYPGFGAGCCMALFNAARENVIQKIAEKDPG